MASSNSKSNSEFATPTITEESRAALSRYIITILDTHRLRTDVATKMEAIDQAYYRFSKGESDGSESCDIFNQDRVTPPIVVSQVDSMVAYLAEVFLSGSPLFPVVSTPSNRQWAEQLEILLDDHALLGGYPRQLLLMLRNAVKYNFGPLECDWTSINQFAVDGDFMNTTNGTKVSAERKYYNSLKALDCYNTVWDPSVAPADVAAEGDYAGYIEIYSYMRLKRMIASYQKRNKVYDINKAVGSGRMAAATGTTQYFRQRPDISDMMSSYNPNSGVVDWGAWLSGGKKRSSYNNLMGYEVVKMYLRILPSDFGISVPQQNTAQIWKVILVNGRVLVAERIVSAYDLLPILIAQPIEDGFGLQTPGVAEGEVEFQEAAGTLFNIRFAAARRAVSDRALYLPGVIDPKDVNAKGAAPKIPVKLSSLANTKLTDVYHQIPFDMRGLETTLNDAQTIVNFSKELHGQNSPRQGQFQKGNKSVREWADTMGASEERLRLPALVLEYQLFSPLKSMMTLNIFQYADDVTVVSQKTGNAVKIDIKQLRQQVLSFRLADGYSPKSKIASTEVLTSGLQLILGSQVLQQAYGNQLPAMFAHMMSLGGVRGIDEYAIKAEGQVAPGLQANTLQPNTPAAPAVPTP